MPQVHEKDSFYIDFFSVITDSGSHFELEFTNVLTIGNHIGNRISFGYNAKNIGLVMDFIESTKAKKSVKGKKLNKFIQLVWED